MQAVEKNVVPTSPKVIVFHSMGAQVPSPPERPEQLLPAPIQPTWWQQHGTTATWIGIVVALLVGVGNTGSNWYFRHADRSEKSADEHINGLIDAKVNPVIDKVNDHIDKKLGELSNKIDDLSVRVARIEGPLNKRVSSLEHQADRQASLAKLNLWY